MSAASVVFLAFAVHATNKIESALQQAQCSIQLIKRLNERIAGSVRNARRPTEFVFSNSNAPDDLDLFGPYSLFSLVNECLTVEGEKLLSHWLSEGQRLETFPSMQELKERQSRVASIAGSRSLTLGASRIQARLGDRLIPLSQLSSLWKKPLINGRPIVVRSALILWLGLLPLLAAKFLVFYPIWVVLNLIALQQIGRLYHRIEEALNQTDALAIFMAKFNIENSDKTSCSQQLKKRLGQMRSLNSLLSVETNPYVLLPLHLFLPWTPLIATLLEKLRSNVSTSIGNSEFEVARVDALRSFAILQRYFSTICPELTSGLLDNQVPGPIGKPISLLKAEGLRHPLLAGARAVPNDMDLSKLKPHGLVTGSNMSGKSTWLRTVGLNICLANAGAPVFAKKFVVEPRPLYTALRVKDSLEEGDSYFSAEVNRILSLLSQARRGRCWYLIDEMFRGTNSREQGIASEAVLKELHQTASVGLTATHDLELATKLSLTSQQELWHFGEILSTASSPSDARVDVRFDYRLRKGVSTSTNALRLLRARGLTIQES